MKWWSGIKTVQRSREKSGDDDCLMPLTDININIRNPSLRFGGDNITIV